MQHSVKIGPEFFAGAFREYSNWHYAIARELAQNSFDCGATNFNATIALEAGNTRLTVLNDGEPMTEDTLINKLLTLGGSGKKFQGTVGGFGQAKHVIYLCHKEYRIHTGHILVNGIGASYELLRADEYMDGTESSILIAGNKVEALIIQFKRFAAQCQWAGTIRINDQIITDRTIKGARRKEYPWGVIYTNNTHPGQMLVRIGGIPMFTKPISYKGCVLVELTGASSDHLTSNRDGLTYNAQSDMDEFIVSIATNARKAFKEPKQVLKTVYPGYKLAGIVINDANTAAMPTSGDMVLAAKIAQTTEKTATDNVPAITIADIQRIYRPMFYIRNELTGKIPTWFLPDSFSDGSKRLVSNWIAILVELAMLTKSAKPFAVGFCFDDDARGLHEHESGNSIIYVNPLSVVEKPGKPRQLKTYWSFDAKGNWELLSLAVHEFVHHQGYSDHDERYANALTDLFTLVLANRTRLSRHFNAPICWPS